MDFFAYYQKSFIFYPFSNTFYFIKWT